MQDGVKFLLIILKIVTLYSPLKVFFPVALAAFLLGATQAANPVLAAAVERILPPSRVALGYATYQLAFAIGFGGGGVAAGFLYEAEPLLPFIVTVALALPVAAIVALILTRITAVQAAA